MCLQVAQLFQALVVKLNLAMYLAHQVIVQEPYKLVLNALKDTQVLLAQLHLVPVPSSAIKHAKLVLDVQIIALYAS